VGVRGVGAREKQHRVHQQQQKNVCVMQSARGLDRSNGLSAPLTIVVPLLQTVSLLGFHFTANQNTLKIPKNQ